MLWMPAVSGNKKWDRWVYLTLLIYILSLGFSIRFLLSIITPVLLLVLLFHPLRKTLVRRAFGSPIFLSFLFLFLIQLTGLLYTSDTTMGWKEVVRKSNMVAISFFFCAWGFIPRAVMRWLMTFFVISICATALYCLGYAAMLYIQGAPAYVFFYHHLVKPIEHHAVFFSFYFLAALIYFLESCQEVFMNRWKILSWCLFFFSLVIIFLLSSKLAIVLTALYLVVYGIRLFVRKKGRALLPVFALLVVIVTLATIFTDNPVRYRFEDLKTGNTELFKRDSFSTDMYFNGFQFRMMTWRFTYQILQREKAWLLGVSPGNAQHMLDDRYEATHMYLGDASRQDSGFRGFNCHNLYLQTLLESGLAGLFLLLIGIASFIVIAFRRKKRTALLFFTCILAFSLVESLLSSQYALQLFPFLSMLFLSEDKD